MTKIQKTNIILALAAMVLTTLCTLSILQK